MSTFRTRVVRDPEDPAIVGIEPLFKALHDEMAAAGMRLKPTEGGAGIWLDGIRQGLERFGRLAVTESGGEVIGFAYANLKLAPEHLGGERIGHIAFVYVVPAHRRGGIARALVAELDEWLRSRQVASIELQVLDGNTTGIAFWRSLGYVIELVQMRRS